MTREQCRAGRAFLDWTHQKLADAAGVSLSTVKDYEAGRRSPIPATLGAMRAAMEKRGVGFADDTGTWSVTLSKAGERAGG